jgi:hypothetical protein
MSFIISGVSLSTRSEIRHDLSCGICAISGNGKSARPKYDRRLVLVPVDYCGCQKEAAPNRNTAERGADKSEAEQ